MLVVVEVKTDPARSNCWTSAGYPGVGLQAGYFDACNAFTSTARRQLGVDFGDAISLPRAAGILTRLDENTGQPVVPPTSDLSDVVVAIVGGWATDGRSIGYAANGCTRKKFNASPVDGYITLTADDPYGGPDAAMSALVNGDADAMYVYSGIVEDRQGCTQQGCNASLYDGLGTKYAWIHKDICELCVCFFDLFRYFYYDIFFRVKVLPSLFLMNRMPEKY